MQLVRHNPMRDLRKLEQDLDKFWSSDFGTVPIITESAPMNMYEEDGKLITEITMPHFTKEEITVTTSGGMLQVVGEHKEREEDKNKRHYYLRENSNEYLRRVALPDGVDTDKTEAELTNGLLKVTMPMQVPEIQKTIKVK